MTRRALLGHCNNPVVANSSSHFLDFTFDWDRDELRHGPAAIKLRPKTLALLRVLLERPGELIAKDELTRLVWPGLAVTDVVLNVCVAELRRALGDSASQPRFLETVHRRGFRFIAPITAERSGNRRASWADDSVDDDVFVGRGAELGLLSDCWDRACAGQSQVVIVSGDAGIGKTALVDHFLDGLDGKLIIGRGQCLDLNAAAEPFLPVLEALKAICTAPAAAFVVDLVRRHAPSWQPHLPCIAGGAAVPAGERAGHQSMVRELVAALHAIAQQTPLVLVLEDLHWSDPSSVDLVVALAQARAAARLLVIGSLRPADAILQGHPRRLLRLAPSGRGRVREVHLELLGEESVRQYLERRLGDAETAALLAPHVASRTDGSPLFMVAVIDHLIDEGTLQPDGDRWRVARPLAEIAEEIPPSITRLLRAQSAEFDERERAALDAACVAGPWSTSQIVAAVMDCTLEEAERVCAGLVDRRFLIDCGPVEWRDGSIGEAYRFRHMIYRQVVESSLTGGHRQALHLRIGERLERGYGDRAHEVAGAMAVHFHAGGDYERAFKYSKLAGRRAMDRSAYQESIDHMRAAHAALLRLPPGEIRDRDELRLLTYLGPLLVAVRGVNDGEAESLATRLRELARRTGRQLAQLASYARSTVIWRTRGEIEIADAIAHEVLLLAQELEEEGLLLSAHFLIGGNRFHCGDLEAARRHFETAVEIADRRDDIAGNLILEGIAAASRCQLAVALLLGGEADAARDAVETALCRHAGSPLVVVRATLNVLAGWAFVLLRDVDRVDALVTAVADQSPIVLWSSVAQMMRGWVEVQRGRIETGLADVEAGFAEYMASQGEASTFDYQVLRADAYLSAGRNSEAMRVVDAGMETLARYKQMYFAPEMYRIRGELLAAEPIRAAKAAEECWQEGLILARTQNSAMFELRLGLLLARSMMSAGRDVAAQRLLRPLLARVERGGETAAVVEAGQLLSAMRP